MNKFKKMNLSLEQKSAVAGNLFVLPFYLGFIFFFLIPIVKSIYYVFCKVSFDVSGIITDFIGFENLNYIFNKDLDFKENLIISVTELLWKTPVCIIMSLLLALLINRKNAATPFIRAVFFLPVIFTSGVVLNTIQNDSVANLMMSGTVISSTGNFENHSTLTTLLVETGLNSKIVDLFSTISSSVFKVMYDCGIPMLIFLSALQGISPSLYESAQIDGANPRQTFFKITLPLISQILLYVLITSLIGGLQMFDVPKLLTGNGMAADRSAMTIVMLLDNHLYSKNYGMAGAISVILFVVAAVLSLLVFAMVKEREPKKKKAKAQAEKGGTK